MESSIIQIIVSVIGGGLLVAIINRMFTRSDIHRTESATVTVKQIDDAAALRQDLIKRNEKLEREKAEAAELLFEKMEREIEALSLQIENLQTRMDKSRTRENDLENHLREISLLQAQRIEKEAEIRIENGRLKAEVKELKESVRSSIEFYETELSKKEKELQILKDESNRQSKEIDKMKKILTQHQIVLDEQEDIENEK